MRASTLGTIVRLPDGRVGTSVYNGLDGVGVKWGVHAPSEDDFRGTTGNLLALDQDSPAHEPDWPWAPDAMLRDDYPGADIECVGEVFDIIDSAEVPS